MGCSFEPRGRRGAVATAAAVLFVAGCALVTGSTGAAEPALTATVVADAATAAVGSTDGYTISISDAGTHQVTLSSVFDELPAGFSYVPGSTSGLTSTDPTVSGERLEWPGAFQLAGGSTVSLRFRVKVAGRIGRYLNVAGGVGPDGAFDSGPAAPIDVVGDDTPLSPPQPADLAVSVGVSPATAYPGDPVAVTIGVANRGPGNATGIRLDVSIPANLIMVGLRADSGTCSGAAAISCSLGGLYLGRSATVTVDAVAGAVGAAATTAVVKGDDPDPDVSSNAGSATLTVLQPTAQPPPPPPVPPPTAGETVNVEPEAGRVLVKVPASSSFVPLTRLRQIPVGSQVDTTAGKVELTVASKGATYSALFYEGRFVVQQPGAGIAAELSLVGGTFASCPAAAKPQRLRSPLARDGAAPRTVRKLWGKGKGRFRTRGRFSAGTVRGTTWLVADRCDGTLTKVVAGTVTVTDFVARKTVTVRAGKSYLAARPH